MFRKDLEFYKDEFLRKKIEQNYQRRVRESNFHDPLGFLGQTDTSKYRSIITDEEIEKYLKIKKKDDEEVSSFSDILKVLKDIRKFKIEKKKKEQKIKEKKLKKLGREKKEERRQERITHEQKMRELREQRGGQRYYQLPANELIRLSRNL